MENTPENKAKFFAQYYGSPAVWKHNTQPSEELVWNTINFWQVDNGDYLELKPLSSISDEDLEGIYPHGSEAFFIYYGNGDKELAVDRFLYKFQLQPEYIDFLRLRGYAVPWAGLSVEKQLEYGWVKLTETAIKQIKG